MCDATLTRRVLLPLLPFRVIALYTYVDHIDAFGFAKAHQ
jgi:hypothetical protein